MKFLFFLVISFSWFTPVSAEPPSSEQITENHPWGDGNLLIASSTIFAFVSFGSFIIHRFQNGNKPYILENIKGILACVFYIGFSQILILNFVIHSWLYPWIYTLLMTGVAIAFGLILLFIYEINAEESREPKVKELITNLENLFDNNLQSFSST